MRTLAIAVYRSSMVNGLPMIKWPVFEARAPILRHFIKRLSSVKMSKQELEIESIHAAKEFADRNRNDKPISGSCLCCLYDHMISV